MGAELGKTGALRGCALDKPAEAGRDDRGTMATTGETAETDKPGVALELTDAA